MNTGIFGIGEAGALIAGDLVAAGMCVSAYDPADVLTPRGVHRMGAASEAVREADLVLAITAGRDAETALMQAVEHIPKSTLYADMSTNSIGVKHKLAAIAAARNIAFADIALMGTVPGQGLRTPMLASGPGASRIKEMFAAWSLSITVISEVAGDAATHKLLRSIMMKGLAATVIEALRGAEQVGCVGWLWANLAEEIKQADEQFLSRLVHGSEKHAARRIYEMQAVTDLLGEIGVEPVMVGATLESLRGIHKLGIPELPE